MESKSRAPMRYACFFLFIPVSLILAGCAPADRILFLKTPYNIYEYEVSTPSAKELKEICAQNHLAWSHVVFEADKPPELILSEAREQIASGGIKYIIIDPLLVFPREELIRENPGVGFVVWGPPESFTAVNLLQVEFDKSPAYRKAGQICGRLLQNQVDFLNAIQAPGERLKLGRISSQREAANIALLFRDFREEFTKEYPERDLLQKKVRNLHDRNDIDRKMEELVQQGVVIVFPGVSLSNSHCLQQGAKKNLFMVMENWWFTGSVLDKHVLLSISESFNRAIQEILLQADSEQGNAPGAETDTTAQELFRWPGSRLQIPAELIRNKTLEFPPGLD